MSTIPRPALLLGLAGVLPFAALAILPPFLNRPHLHLIADALLSDYAIVILAFMSGCIWAFAAKKGDGAGMALSTLPALFGWCTPLALVLMGRVTPAESLGLLGAGFLALLLLDRRAVRLGQAPSWWLKLRVLLTGLVVPLLLMAAVT